MKGDRRAGGCDTSSFPAYESSHVASRVFSCLRKRCHKLLFEYRRSQRKNVIGFWVVGFYYHSRLSGGGLGLVRERPENRHAKIAILLPLPIERRGVGPC